MPCLQLLKSAAQSQGFASLPCARHFVKHTAPFPRTAFTMKHGKVLYNRAIHSGIDASKVLPREYSDHGQLQAMMVEEVGYKLKKGGQDLVPKHLVLECLC